MLLRLTDHKTIPSTTPNSVRTTDSGGKAVS